MREAKHTAIVGQTGSGKTNYASLYYGSVPKDRLAIFINTNHEKSPEKVSDAIVYDLQGLGKAFNDHKARKICVNPPQEGDIEVATVEAIVKLLFDMGNVLTEKGVKDWCYFFVDEAQDYSSKLRKSAVIDRVWRRGRRYGITGVAISQRPAEISHTILVNCKFHIVFLISSYENQYFKEYQIPVYEGSEAYDWIQKQYHYVIWNGQTIEYKQPVQNMD